MIGILRRHDRVVSISVITIVVLGLLTIRSVAESFFSQQLTWFVIGLVVAVLAAMIDFRPLVAHRWFVIGSYGVAMLLLLLTFFFAPSIREARSWLVIGPVQFQTSELAKVALIIVLSYFFARAHVGIARMANIFKSFVLFFIPAFLVFLQPDLGTTLIFFLVWIGFLFVSGISWRYVLLGLITFSLLGAIAWGTVLADYQKNRIIGFLNPSFDPLGINYSVIQSKIAVGSAGLFGKGYGQGTQAQLGFLPESHSDFIFSAFIEEWGLVGGGVLVVLFLILLTRIIIIGFRSQSNFFRLMSLGVAILFISQFALNTGSALGFLPVTGVTFPFFSYGGSSLLINMLLIGIIQSIAIHSSFIKERNV